MAYRKDVITDGNGGYIRPCTVTDNVVNPFTRKSVTEELEEINERGTVLEANWKQATVDVKGKIISGIDANEKEHHVLPQVFHGEIQSPTIERMERGIEEIKEKPSPTEYIDHALYASADIDAVGKVHHYVTKDGVHHFPAGIDAKNFDEQQGSRDLININEYVDVYNERYFSYNSIGIFINKFSSLLRITEPIFCTEGDVFYTGGLSLFGSLNGVAIVVYMDELKQCIGKIDSQAGYGEKVVIPEGVSYVAFCFTSGGVMCRKDIYDAHVEKRRKDERALRIPVVPKYIDATIGCITPIYRSMLTAKRHCQFDVCAKGEVYLTDEDVIICKPTYNGSEGVLEFYLDNLDNYVSRTTIRCITKSGDKSVKNIMLIGDSLIDGRADNAAYRLYSRLREDNDYTINAIGTRGAENYNHEGRGGWSLWQYLTRKSNATDGAVEPTDMAYNEFLNESTKELDFSMYMGRYINGYTDPKDSNHRIPAHNVPNRLDYVIISLGTNDVNQAENAYPDVITSINKYGDGGDLGGIKTIVSNMKQMVEKILQAYPNCKIAIGLPAGGSNVKNEMIMRRNLSILCKAYIEEFDDGKHHPNVTVVAHGCQMNPKSYKTSNMVSNSVTQESATYYTDGAHPTKEGYYQWGDAYYNKIRAFMSGLL